MASEEGSVIAGKYLLRSLLGRGGVGSVFEAERISDGKIFALKRLDRAGTHDEVAMGRFAREVRAASTARSGHIVQVVDVGTDDGCPFLLMERLHGEDLGTHLRETPRMDPGEVAEIARQVLSGLRQAHAAGVVHRDLKPDNIFLSSPEKPGVTPKVNILDFGMSKIQPLGTTVPLALTRRGVAVGTPLYMSPEQASARADVDAQSDLYSVGAIMFECVTGRPPHVGETSDAVLRSIRTKRAPLIREVMPGLAPQLADIIDRALEVDRATRFSNAEQMMRAVVDAAAALRAQPSRRATRTLWLAGGCALVVGVMIALVGSSWMHGRALPTGGEATNAR